MPAESQKEHHFSSTSTLEISDCPTPKTQTEEEKICTEQQKTENEEESPNYEHQETSISNEYSNVEEDEKDRKDSEQGVYDDVGLPSQERVNSLYAGSSAGSQPGSTSNGKESEWEDLEDVKPSLPLPKRNVAW